MTDPITEADLLAFVDGQLDAARRIEVEDYLAHRPETAARVMADLHVRDTLRLAVADAPARPSPALLGRRAPARARLSHGAASR